MTAATPQPPPVSDLECKVCAEVNALDGDPWAGSGYTAPEGGVTAGQAAPVADVNELVRRVRQAWDSAFTGSVETSVDVWQAQIAVDTILAAIAAQDARPAPELAAAMAELADALEAEGREEIAIARKRPGTRHEVGMQRGRVFELCVDRIRRVAGLPS